MILGWQQKLNILLIFQDQEKNCLSLYYNGNNSFLFVNATKVCQFKAKNSKIKPYSLCVGRISKDFALSNMKKKTGLNGYVYNNSVDYNVIDNSKYLMKIHDIK